MDIGWWKKVKAASASSFFIVNIFVFLLCFLSTKQICFKALLHNAKQSQDPSWKRFVTSQTFQRCIFREFFSHSARWVSGFIKQNIKTLLWISFIIYFTIKCNIMNLSTVVLIKKHNSKCLKPSETFLTQNSKSSVFQCYSKQEYCLYSLFY